MFCSAKMMGMIGPSLAQALATLGLVHFFKSDFVSILLISVTDVDECTRPDIYPCQDNAICENTLGSYSCSCDAPAWKVDPNNKNLCTDVNECTEGANLCAANATCTNSEGGYSCACDMGYAGNGFTCEGKAS